MFKSKTISFIWPFVAGVPLVALAVVLWNVEHWKIPQEGMAPNYPAGSRVWARKSPYRTVADVRRGDVVVYREIRADGSYDFVSRVIALPNEKIAMKDDVVFVDGRPLMQRRAKGDVGADIFEEAAGERSYLVRVARGEDPKLAQFPEFEVPAGHLFMMGDNRRDSSDSRARGPVPFRAILARAFQWKR